MAVDFYIKQDDQLPEIRAQLQDASGQPVVLSSATVRFVMADKATGTVKIDQQASIIDAETGRVGYAWTQGDTDTAGNYRAEWEVKFSDGRLETFPNSSYIEIKVVSDLGGFR